MTQDEIIRMAREAGMTVFVIESLERFAALVAAHERNRLAWTQEHWTEYEHAIAAAERELCAQVCEEIAKRYQIAGMMVADECAAAIRAIKFEGDTGFRPVSEMIAEHKQDPKKAAAIERARERLANKLEIVSQEPKSDCPCCGAKSSVLPMAFCRECKSEFWPPKPIRTKDLTDAEIADALYGKGCWRLGVHPVHLREYRRVIQADRELNK